MLFGSGKGSHAVGTSNRCTVRIDDGVKRDILARTDIGDYIGTVVSLRKRGNDLVGLCPFHGEKTPSFHVHPDRGFFKCFGCDAAGDVIRFVQLHENVNFVDALRMLAKRAGIELENEDPASARARSEKEALYHANDVAARYFHRVLTTGPEGKVARDYCAARGISDASIATFKLGFAPDRWDGLTAELAREGVEPELAAKAGLVKAGQRGYYDFYRDRLMIPTHAITGETIAFGGRLIGPGEPKYLNTTTTPVYTKGRYLFALGIARRSAQRDGSIVIVEGYLDCIALHAVGVTNAVASLGTAFTVEQARELRKATENVFVCFDGDAAGQAATAKSVDTLIGEGLAARIVQLAAGEDPDSFVRAHGEVAFRERLATAIPWVQFKIDRRIAEIQAGFKSRAQIAREAEILVRTLPRAEWDHWRTYAAPQLGVDVDDLRKARLLINEGARLEYGEGQLIDVRRSDKIRPGSVASPSWETACLAIFVSEPGLVGEYGTRIAPERFAEPALRRIYGRLRERAPALVQPADVFALFSDDGDVSATLASIAGSERSSIIRFGDTESRRAYLDRTIERFAADDRQRRIRELDAEITALFEAGRPVPQELREEHSALHTARTKG
jgi:DNA primase